MKGTLNNWELAKFDRPGTFIVCGFLGSKEMRTSRVVRLDLEANKLETENSIYGLGTPKKG